MEQSQQSYQRLFVDDLSVTIRSMSFSIRPEAVSSVLRECCQRDGCGTLSLCGSC